VLNVFIWNYRGKSEAWGHASMQVDQTYISWWPERPGQVPSKVHPNIYDSHPIRNRTFSGDVAAERQPPDHTIRIGGLDETAIKDWWQSFGLTRDGVLYQGPLQSWATLSRNCSTVVATGLRHGGGDDHASWVKSWNLVWTPADVLSYAQSIQRGLAQAPVSNPSQAGRQDSQLRENQHLRTRNVQGR
jgi:hypothetical protein